MKLINKSKWPTPALRVLARWAGIQGEDARQYTVIVQAARTTWHGCGGNWRQRIWMPRHYLGRYCPSRKWPKTITHGHRYCGAFEYRSNIEVLLYLMAHELGHRKYGSGKENETACTRRGELAVLHLRGHQAEFRKELWAAMRKAHACKAARPVVNAVDKKMAETQARLGTWERKLKLAQTKVRKYRGKVARMEKRLAADKV